jgi:hypothetical protein
MDRLTTGVRNPERLDLLFQYILAIADSSEDFRSRELGPIHLLKYAYLADLAFAERNDGETFTGTDWSFHHFGPWSASAFERIEPSLVAIGAVSRKVPSKFRDDFVRYSIGDVDHDELRAQLERPLPWSVVSAIGSAVHQHGSDTADLLRHVYLTPPMLAAKPGDALDFTIVAVARRLEGDAVLPHHHELSSKESRERAQRIAKARARIAERLANGARGALAPMPAPRYDDVFFQGTAQLDASAGEPLKNSEGVIEFDDSVWASAQRRENDLP